MNESDEDIIRFSKEVTAEIAAALPGFTPAEEEQIETIVTAKLSDERWQRRG